MLNALDNLPEDPVELRRVTELLASEVKAQALMIEKLQHQLHGANRHRFGSKSEGMDQLQLFAENEEIDEDFNQFNDPTWEMQAKAVSNRLHVFLQVIEGEISAGRASKDNRVVLTHDKFPPGTF